MRNVLDDLGGLDAFQNTNEHDFAQIPFEGPSLDSDLTDVVTDGLGYVAEGVGDVAWETATGVSKVLGEGFVHGGALGSLSGGLAARGLLNQSYNYHRRMGLREDNDRIFRDTFLLRHLPITKSQAVYGGYITAGLGVSSLLPGAAPLLGAVIAGHAGRNIWRQKKIPEAVLSLREGADILKGKNHVRRYDEASPLWGTIYEMKEALRSIYGIRRLCNPSQRDLQSAEKQVNTFPEQQKMEMDLQTQKMLLCDLCDIKENTLGNATTAINKKFDTPFSNYNVTLDCIDEVKNTIATMTQKLEEASENLCKALSANKSPIWKAYKNIKKTPPSQETREAIKDFEIIKQSIDQSPDSVNTDQIRDDFQKVIFHNSFLRTSLSSYFADINYPTGDELSAFLSSPDLRDMVSDFLHRQAVREWAQKQYEKESKKDPWRVDNNDSGEVRVEKIDRIILHLRRVSAEMGENEEARFLDDDLSVDLKNSLKFLKNIAGAKVSFDATKKEWRVINPSSLALNQSLCNKIGETRGKMKKLFSLVTGMRRHSFSEDIILGQSGETIDNHLRISVLQGLASSAVGVNGDLSKEKVVGKIFNAVALEDKGATKNYFDTESEDYWKTNAETKKSVLKNEAVQDVYAQQLFAEKNFQNQAWAEADKKGNLPVLTALFEKSVIKTALFTFLETKSLLPKKTVSGGVRKFIHDTDFQEVDVSISDFSQKNGSELVMHFMSVDENERKEFLENIEKKYSHILHSVYADQNPLENQSASFEKNFLDSLETENGNHRILEDIFQKIADSSPSKTTLPSDSFAQKVNTKIVERDFPEEKDVESVRGWAKKKLKTCLGKMSWKKIFLGTYK